MRAKPEFCECGNAVGVFYANHWMCGRCRDLAVAAMYQHRAPQKQGERNDMSTYTYYRARRQNMVGRFCECGSPATVNRNGYFICDSCANLESLAAHYANRRMVAGEADNSRSRNRMESGRRVESALLDPDMVRVTVEETTEEIVLHAHGEYHLKLSTGLELVLEQEGVCGV